ncbi:MULTISPECIES: barstar family protein [unclassified Curtobacterium]|uniref:barstar family protein n=1 Tax=unclassified Curtobacterium TaxID=257496 RepID=UPI0009FCFBDC|nr:MULTISPECIES: barstar family protein [unclassified Curtobacterium]
MEQNPDTRGTPVSTGIRDPRHHWHPRISRTPRGGYPVFAEVAFVTAVHFASHFGKNLAALNDCMSDVAEAEYGWDATETGLVLILSGFARFAQ